MSAALCPVSLTVFGVIKQKNCYATRRSHEFITEFRVLCPHSVYHYRVACSARKQLSIFMSFFFYPLCPCTRRRVLRAVGCLTHTYTFLMSCYEAALSQELQPRRCRALRIVSHITFPCCCGNQYGVCNECEDRPYTFVYNVHESRSDA